MMALLVICMGVTASGGAASASYYDAFQYNRGDKLYTKKTITKGTKPLNRNVKKDATQFQIVKMSGNHITLRPQKGWWMSDDPYFKSKKMTYKLSSKCKFYYRDVTYPYSGTIKYKRVRKSSVRKYMNDSEIQYEYVEEAGKKCYTGGYFGDIYMKNGKVAAVITDGGD